MTQESRRENKLTRNDTGEARVHQMEVCPESEGDVEGSGRGRRQSGPDGLTRLSLVTW